MSGWNQRFANRRTGLNLYRGFESLPHRWKSGEYLLVVFYVYIIQSKEDNFIIEALQLIILKDWNSII